MKWSISLTPKIESPSSTPWMTPIWGIREILREPAALGLQALVHSNKTRSLICLMSHKRAWSTLTPNFQIKILFWTQVDQMVKRKRAVFRDESARGVKRKIKKWHLPRIIPAEILELFYLHLDSRVRRLDLGASQLSWILSCCKLPQFRLISQPNFSESRTLLIQAPITNLENLRRNRSILIKLHLPRTAATLWVVCRLPLKIRKVLGDLNPLWDQWTIWKWRMLLIHHISIKLHSNRQTKLLNLADKANKIPKLKIENQRPCRVPHK